MVLGPRAYRSGPSAQSPPLLFVRFHPSPPPTSFTARGQKTIEKPKLQSTQNWGSCLERTWEFPKTTSLLVPVGSIQDNDLHHISEYMLLN